MGIFGLGNNGAFGISVGIVIVLVKELLFGVMDAAGLDEFGDDEVDELLLLLVAFGAFLLAAV